MPAAKPDSPHTHETSNVCLRKIVRSIHGYYVCRCKLTLKAGRQDRVKVYILMQGPTLRKSKWNPMPHWSEPVPASTAAVLLNWGKHAGVPNTQVVAKSDISQLRAAINPRTEAVGSQVLGQAGYCCQEKQNGVKN